MEGNEISRTINNMDDMAKITSWYTERAIQFINKNKKDPFFLYLPHTMTHIPIAVSEKFKGKSKQGLYGDVMMEIDWSVGEILNTLKKNKLDQNTLVIFTSDNGPWLKFGNHAGSSGGLREGKMTSWDGGQKVSCIMKWPSLIPKGTVNNALACAIDFLPTFAALTKAPLSVNKIDGVNILPLLKGEDVNPRTEILYYFGENDLRAIRVGDWKLVFPHAYPTANVPGNNGLSGKTPSLTTDLALYDLRRDPGEFFNVLNQYPEIVLQLKQSADKAREDLGDNLVKIEAKNNRAPGRISN
jgi:arylsulfatase